MKKFLLKTASTLARIAAAIGAATLCACQSGAEISTAKNVDLKKYAGEWIEVARIENSFQRGMKKCRATYELKDDGQMKVVNAGIKPDGRFSSVEGSAYAPDPDDASRLRVSFFWPFYSDYLILDFADDYSWAIVGGSQKKYFWILARKTPDKKELSALLARAEKLGYDTSTLVFDEQ